MCERFPLYAARLAAVREGAREGLTAAPQARGGRRLRRLPGRPADGSTQRQAAAPRPRRTLGRAASAAGFAS